MACQTETNGRFLDSAEFMQTKDIVNDLDSQMRKLSEKITAFSQMNESLLRQNEVLLSQT